MDLKIPIAAGIHSHPGDKVKVQVPPEVAAEINQKGPGTLVYLYKESGLWVTHTSPIHRTRSRANPPEAAAKVATAAPMESAPVVPSEAPDATSEPSVEPKPAV